MRATEFLKKNGLDWEAEEWYDELWEMFDWFQMKEKNKKTSLSIETQMKQYIVSEGLFCVIEDRGSLMDKFKLSGQIKKIPGTYLKEVRFSVVKNLDDELIIKRITDDEYGELEHTEELTAYFTGLSKKYEMEVLFGGEGTVTEEMMEALREETDLLMDELTGKGVIEFLLNDLVAEIKKEYEALTALEKQQNEMFWASQY